MTWLLLLLPYHRGETLVTRWPLLLPMAPIALLTWDGGEGRLEEKHAHYFVAASMPSRTPFSMMSLPGAAAAIYWRYLWPGSLTPRSNNPR